MIALALWLMDPEKMCVESIEDDTSLEQKIIKTQAYKMAARRFDCSRMLCL